MQLISAESAACLLCFTIFTYIKQHDYWELANALSFREQECDKLRRIDLGNIESVLFSIHICQSQKVVQWIGAQKWHLVL